MSLTQEMTNQERKIAFNKTLREFIQVLLFLSVLGGLGAYLIGTQNRTRQEIYCGAEYVKSKHRDLMYYNNGNYIAGGSLQSTDFAHNGTASIQLSGSDPFGFNYTTQPLIGNENFYVSVWRFADGQHAESGKMVASGKCGFWKAGEEVIEKSDNGWEKIQFSFSPPKKCKNKQIQIYCWNTASNPIYFDDLYIEIKRVYF